MTDTAGLKLDIQGHTAILTIHNPPANTWNETTLYELKTTVESLNQNRDVYALVVVGSGDKFFSAGADLNRFAEGDHAVARKMARCFGEAFEALTAFRGVSIAAINGYAMGGGLECALSCDLRIAERQAQMALPEAKVGLLPCAGGTQNLPWLVGEGWAKRMILCGERISAEKALAIGLVEEVVETGEALSRALTMAEMACQQSPTSVAACKSLIMSAREQRSHADGWRLERERFVDLFDSEDQREGVQAFLQKRTPEWKNR
ncbi:enoyl-CoA hydratase [Terasakiispira papahanaumokuakeensis]|uniref:Enoyl-CoA hydratase n=1 Tax=Terasakiispira papahanaumokuakeensis TaxID=197479 RepID=A0A1E2V8G3_9GAMM|nr:enoyl-CoA hydratase [Terasakiispira papahanaumokuakeensis]ODC03271.1 enoyl-CoA hydratase [Terasakiispira papahanaumokuakeensis]